MKLRNRVAKHLAVFAFSPDETSTESARNLVADYETTNRRRGDRLNVFCLKCSAMPDKCYGFARCCKTSAIVIERAVKRWSARVSLEQRSGFSKLWITSSARKLFSSWLQKPTMREAHFETEPSSWSGFCFDKLKVYRTLFLIRASLSCYNPGAIAPFPNLVSDSSLVQETIDLLRGSGGRAKLPRLSSSFQSISHRRRVSGTAGGRSDQSDRRLGSSTARQSNCKRMTRIATIEELDFVVVDIEANGAKMRQPHIKLRGSNSGSGAC